MSVQHTNLDTSQDKAKPGQEFNNQELIKKNAPDNREDPAGRRKGREC